MRTQDVWFRGIELSCGPDGAVYVLDWSDIGECHESDGVHRTSGRIFRISYGKPKPLAEPLNNLDSLQLANLQTHPNEWHSRIARRLLQERAMAGDDMSLAKTTLHQIYRETTNLVQHRLRALWALFSIEDLEEDWLLQQLHDENEHIRVWSLKFLTDSGEVSNKSLTSFVRFVIVR